MEATVEILYREIIGAGDDDEAQQSNGIAVTLTYWRVVNSDYRIRNHYMLERKVLINRRFVVDDITMQCEYINEHAKMSRKAVEMVDYLIEQNPQVQDE